MLGTFLREGVQRETGSPWDKSGRLLKGLRGNTRAEGMAFCLGASIWRRLRHEIVAVGVVNGARLPELIFVQYREELDMHILQLFNNGQVFAPNVRF